MSFEFSFAFFPCLAAVNFTEFTMFAKLFARITESSLMEEDIPTRYTFVMLLAIADKDGDVIGTDVAISRRLNMPVAEFRKCVQALMNPDLDSNSKEEEGRRVTSCDGERGYHVVNYVKYREMTTEFQRKEYMKRYMREYRERGKTANDVKLPVNSKSNAKSLHSLTSESECVSGSGSESSFGRSGNLLPTECHPNFPSTSDYAVLAAGLGTGIPEGFIRNTWENAAGRGGKDAKQCPIASWAHWIKAQWGYEQGRRAKEAANRPPPREMSAREIRKAHIIK